MQFKLKEEEIISFLELKYPEKEFEYGRLLVGQHKRDDLDVYYFGDTFLMCTIISFKTFEIKETVELSYDAVHRIVLKDGWLFRKMRIETMQKVLKYGTSKLMLTDFQKENYDKYIQGQKQRVIFENGHFV
ncbi:hypothetical protein HUZ99_05055 [Staphylococcus sp. SS87]|nr:hypothetical protein [Staphylococcus singaporensis]MCS5348442.1 hypothetical protein [Staphylococcus aureus]UMT78389.1 hypothetical protein ML436_01125 [Staphylococcus roterodami]MBE5664345.1 hypothetical protein [Staphylococcus singaporensis]MBE5666049.1 hypothetical protein [Staphylococcus singaporensis]